MALTDKVAFCTLADLKTELGITDSLSDARLERRIIAASAVIESHCQRRFRRTTVTETLIGYGSPTLFISRTPIESVTSLSIDGTAIDSANYTLDGDKGILRALTGAWQWTTYRAATASTPPIPGDEYPDYSCIYIGGYFLPNDTAPMPGTATALPDVLIEACLTIAATMQRRGGQDTGLAGSAAGDASVSWFATMGGLTANAVSDLLANFVRRS